MKFINVLLFVLFTNLYCADPSVRINPVAPTNEKLKIIKKSFVNDLSPDHRFIDYNYYLYDESALNKAIQEYNSSSVKNLSKIKHILRGKYLPYEDKKNYIGCETIGYEVLLHEINNKLDKSETDKKEIDKSKKNKIIIIRYSFNNDSNTDYTYISTLYYLYDENIIKEYKGQKVSSGDIHRALFKKMLSRKQVEEIKKNHVEYEIIDISILIATIQKGSLL
ncbi:MAG: hypothetical protein P4L22_07545 [Candidatus Babeliales bacterium]|nr:hypothetical protein [Candidatus Babeliales bacterium]